MRSHVVESDAVEARAQAAHQPEELAWPGGQGALGELHGHAKAGERDRVRGLRAHERADIPYRGWLHVHEQRRTAAQARLHRAGHSGLATGAIELRDQARMT